MTGVECLGLDTGELCYCCSLVALYCTALSMGTVKCVLGADSICIRTHLKCGYGVGNSTFFSLIYELCVGMNRYVQLGPHTTPFTYHSDEK